MNHSISASIFYPSCLPVLHSPNGTSNSARHAFTWSRGGLRETMFWSTPRVDSVQRSADGRAADRSCASSRGLWARGSRTERERTSACGAPTARSASNRRSTASDSALPCKRPAPIKVTFDILRFGISLQRLAKGPYLWEWLFCCAHLHQVERWPKICMLKEETRPNRTCGGG